MSLSGQKEWGTIFPYGRIPIQCISAQRITFESFADPESVMSVDFKQLTQIQREIIIGHLKEKGKSFVGAVLGDFLKFGLPIPRSNIDCCGIKEWNYLC